MHVLLITWDQGLPICSLVSCLLDIRPLSTMGNKSPSLCYFDDLARTICLAMLNTTSSVDGIIAVLDILVSC